MSRLFHPLACALLAASALAAQLASVPAAQAQDMTTATFGGMTIWIGGGVQFLSVPDIRFAQAGKHRQKNSESDWLDFGGAAGGGFETALGFWGNYRVTGGIKGFWANIETDDGRGATGARTIASFLTPRPERVSQARPSAPRPTAGLTIGGPKRS